MKRILMIGLVLVVAMQVSAVHRTPADALRIADEFVETNGIRRAPGASPITHRLSQIADSSAVYLAVNTRSGFVLVGADERMPEVLGYSDSGAFDPENISPSMRYFLQCYAEELDQLSDHPSPISDIQSRRAISPVEPLCSSIWSQGTPFNNYAPAYNDAGSKSVTGCVATAMAQIMYRYQYPTKGVGSHSYLWIATDPVGKIATLSANFEAVYQWASMRDSYKGSYTPEQEDAVATLMYHCGVSVDMNYGQSSGAFSEKVPVALKTYFGYDPNYQRVPKILYPSDSLNAIIAAELKAQRPVLVSGSNDEGGHAFVCDGCDNKGYFHINWGWGGSNDGYYLLSALNPGRPQGIGGTSQGYNKSTTFFVGLQPAKAGTPVAIPQMGAENIAYDKESFSRSTAFSVSIKKLQNFGLTDFSGSYGVALYDEDETQLITILKQVNNYELKAGYYRTTDATLSSLKIPGTLPAGTYHLCAVYKDANYDWMRLMCTQDDYFRTLTVTASQATFYPNDAEPQMALTKPIAFPAGTNPDSVSKTGIPLSFSVKNTGGTFRGEISARIYKGNFGKGQYEIMTDVVVRRNQTLSSALQQTFDAGLLLETQYKMKLCWRADANDSWHDFTPASYAELPFKLYDADYHIALTDSIRFDNNDSVPRNNANLHYSIKNTGAPFDGELQLSFYESYFSRGKSDIQTVHIGTNETLVGVFSGPLEQTPGTYNVILRYREIDGEWLDFADINGYNIGSIFATIYDDTPSGLETVNGKGRNRKLVHDGQLFILRDNKIYNAQGILVK